MQIRIVEELTSKRITSKEEILRLESRLGGELPYDYLRFLVKWNGGCPEPSVFEFEELGRMTEDKVRYFLGLCDDRHYDIRRILDVYEERIPGGFCPIACDSFGNLLLLGIVRPHHGEVYFWDHERETGEPIMTDMSKVANSFTEFLEMLK